MKKCLVVTGGAGFIGSHLCERLLAEGHRVIAIDDFNDFYNPAFKRENIRNCGDNQNFRLCEQDICDLASLDGVFEREKADVIVHLAARAGVRASIENPILYQRVNCLGTANLLEMARKHAVGHFIFGSSSSVYGATERVPFSEEDEVRTPISPYAASKIAGEVMCHTYHHLFSIDITCLRFFTVYGPRQRPDLAIRKFTEYIDKGKSIPVYGDGSTSRDYTHIDDIMQGLMSAIAHPFGYEIINLGESRTVTLREMIGLIEENLGRKAKMERLPLQPGDMSITYADISKARRMLGYDPRTTIDDGIRSFVDWFREWKARRK
jgi:UDP-glucuronate 4-epimerase